MTTTNLKCPRCQGKMTPQEQTTYRCCEDCFVPYYGGAGSPAVRRGKATRAQRPTGQRVKNSEVQLRD